EPEPERLREALLTLADGRIGTSGAPPLEHPAAQPLVLAAGVYTGTGPATELLHAPLWDRLDGDLGRASGLRRALDLRTGTLRQDLDLPEGRLRTFAFSSLDRPGTAVLRAEGRVPAAMPLSAEDPHTDRTGTAGGWSWIERDSDPVGGIAAAAADRRSEDGERLERLVAYAADGEREPEAGEALLALRAAEAAGFEELLAAHRARWADRWEEADVEIAGDPGLQRDVRFALFHLMASVADRGEAAVGARGLSGPAYRGHVFWDADVFVLPFLAGTHPEAARAMLEYRIRRLPAALEAARTIGRAGARFPWESARSGLDVTPKSARDRTGRLMAIRTGYLEEHIVADVAWAAGCYLDWTGDKAFAAGPGGTLLVETARYWASRIRMDHGGIAHVYGVLGPDEYHDAVDDNAYTNVMARWNLRRAAALAEDAGLADEREREYWIALAHALSDGYDPDSRLYEQFAGFFGLEPLVIADVAPSRPIAADLLLGHDRVLAAQVLKQADVLMLHHLVPEEVEPGSLLPNLDFYEPRTAHGSSLSPGIHASLFARAGRFEPALEALRLTSRIDLDDLTATTAGGLHLAAMGSLWQALAWGFLGLHPEGDALRIDPRLPPAWEGLRVSARFRGTQLSVEARHGSLDVRADGPARVALEGPGEVDVTAPGRRFVPAGEGWKGQEP
ncbi:MAG TPA: glycosyl hydrolase family 65 protein, partial [Actinomycetota bacterium]|nr:glycosyl hydrolase family 65 protein [Actinomycetota bacterium]